jgi:hypothetical protein
MDCAAQAGTKTLKLDMRLMLERQFRGSAQGSSDTGFQKEDLVVAALTASPETSIWEVGHPLLAVLSKPWFPASMIAAVLINVVRLVLLLSFIFGQDVFEGYHFRLTELESRGGQHLTAPGPWIGDFGLLRNELESETVLSVRNVSAAGRSTTLSFDEPVGMNGWWFRTADSLPELDPVRFVFEYSPHREGRDWRLIGSSTAFWTFVGGYIFEGRAYPTPAERQKVVSFDLRPPWPWVIHSVGKLAVLILTCVALFISTVTNNYFTRRWSLVGCCIVSGLVFAASATEYRSHGQHSNAQFSIAYAIINFVWAFCLLMKSVKGSGLCRSTTAAMFLSGAWILASHALYWIGAFQSIGISSFDSEQLKLLVYRALLQDAVGLDGLLLLAAAFFAMGAKRRAAAAADRAVRPDRTLREERWLSLLSSMSNESRLAIRGIEELAKAIQAGDLPPPGQLRQCYRPFTGHRAKTKAGLGGEVSTGLPGAVQPVRAVRHSQSWNEDLLGKAEPLVLCLDQLLAQVAVAFPDAGWSLVDRRSGDVTRPMGGGGRIRHSLLPVLLC